MVLNLPEIEVASLRGFRGAMAAALSVLLLAVPLEAVAGPPEGSVLN